MRMNTADKKRLLSKPGGRSIYFLPTTKALLTMKLMAVLVFASCLQVAARGYAQGVTISVKNASLPSVFKDLRKQTGYFFVYDRELIRSAKRVDIDVKNVSLQQALERCFRDQPLTYLLSENTVVIRKKEPEKKPAETPTAPAPPAIPVKGIIKNEEGVPLSGATVTVISSNISTQANAEGEFSIEVPDTRSVLLISMIGYESQKLIVGDRTSFAVKMIKTQQSLDQVVVVGYGTQKKADVTGSVVRVTTDKTADLPNYNVLQSMQGRVPGLNVTSPDRPGEDPSVSIRGTNSISAGTSPLIVVDGIIYYGSLSDFNANDIASVDILKDASAAAVYGSRAANGVLLISTKTGSTEKPQFNFNSYYGRSNPDHLIDVLDGPGYLQKVLDFRQATGLPADPANIDSYLTVAEAENHKKGLTTDWMDEVLRTGTVNNYHLDVSGKTTNTNYYVSGTYFKQQGIVKNDDYRRISLNMNLTNRITDWLSISVKSMFSTQDFSGREASLNGAYQQSPYGNLYDPTGPGGYALLPVGDAVGVNPFANTLIQNKDIRNSLWGLFSSNLDVPFIPGLKWTMNYSANLRNTKENEFLDNKSSTTGITANGVATKNTTENLGWTWDNFLNYKKTFAGRHSIDVTALYSREYNRLETSGLTGRNFFTQATGYNNVGLAQIQQIQSNYEDQNSISYMGRLNYSFDNRYALTLTARRDGFSGFSQDHKYATFPSIAFAWTVTNEDFLQKVSWLDYLKLRLSYGQNGNQAVGRYQSLARIASNYYVFDQQTITATYVNSIANNELTWETTTTKNIGIDFTVLNKRINGSIDVYSSNTNDILLQRALPQTSGFGQIFTNVGQVHNHGVEISLNSVNIKNDKTKFRWETGFVFTLNRNRIDKLTGQDANKDGREDDDIRNSWFIGESLNSFYGYKIDGIYQLNEANIPAGFRPGDFRITDVNQDGKLTPDDRVILGNRMPNYSFSISNSFSYKNFSLYIMINSIQGGHNNSYMGDNNATRNPNAPYTTFTERFNVQDVPYWTPSRPSNDYPRINYNPTLPHPILEDRSFIRLQDVSLSYTFGQDILRYIRANNLRVYISAKNLYTHTKWTGYDPENSTTISGFPLIRTYTIGVDLKF
jgi:TonB-linked SusC/RagA family outer membrane protein